MVSLHSFADFPEQPHTEQRRGNGGGSSSMAASTIHPVDAAADRSLCHELAQQFIRESISEGDGR